LSNPPQPASVRQRLLEGIGLFNRGEFFECHEALEAAWLESAGETKQFLQGLIQVAVAFYHLRQSNFLGAARLLQAGKDKLSRSSSVRAGVDAAALLKQIAELPDRIECGEIPPDWPAPQIRLLASYGNDADSTSNA
jgi:predicted metal-dependent hydrolase